MTEQILVFGAKGYIGRVVSKLLDINPLFDPVRVYREYGKQVLYLQGRRLEFENFESLGAHLSRHARVRFAINAAAQTQKGSSHEEIQQLVDSNVAYTSHIAKLCVEAGVERLVHFGTFSTSVDGLNPDPQTFYAATKAASYEVLRYFSARESLQVRVLELYDVYAADHPHGKVISKVTESLSRRESMTLSVGGQEMAPVHALDVAKSAIEALRIPGSQPFTIWSLPGPETLTLRELVQTIGKALKLEQNTELIEFTAPYRTHEVMKVSPRFEIFPIRPEINLHRGLSIGALD